MRRNCGVYANSPAHGMAFAVFLAAVAVAHANCQIETVDLPVTMEGLSPIVNARINDTDVKFIADSGAIFSAITPASAAQLGLALRPAPDWIRVDGVGGRVDVSLVRVERFALRKSVIPNVEFLVAGHNEFGAGSVGLLGQNLFSIADAEYDLANGAIRIVYPSDGCKNANMAYWAGTKPVVIVDLEHPNRMRVQHTIATVTINGKNFRAMFDTGAGTSVLSLDAAKSLKIGPWDPGVVAKGETYGIGERKVLQWIAPIKSFAIGTEVIRNMHLRVADLGMSDWDMLIGDDFFLAHRIFVANSQDRMYLTYNGGPAFNLAAESKPAAAAESGAASASAIADGAGSPADAAAFARRGAALAARHEIDRALADLDHAIEMAPTVGSYFFERGRIQLLADHPVPARNDFDEALRLDPSLAEARLNRARLSVKNHEYESARADLLALDQSLARQDNKRYEIGVLYVKMETAELATPQFTAWIAAHRGEIREPDAYNARCWARAQSGTELDQALSDCNVALDAKPESSYFLDSRGLVYLRLGRIDEAYADFDKSLHFDPKQAWSLYGRGLIRLRRGEKRSGEADIAAAKALKPTIEEDAKRLAIVN